MGGYQHDSALDHRIRELGGVIDEAHGDRVVTFPEQPRADAREIEAAVERAREYGTRCLPVWRERGAGYFVAESHAEHPGWVYLCQIDTVTGQPVRCECIAGATGGGHICHHLGAAIAAHREEVGYEANGAAALAGWEETLAMARANAPKETQEEDWL